MKHSRYLILIPVLIIASCGGGKQMPEVAEEEMESELVTLTEAQMSKGVISTGELSYRNMSATVQVNGVVDVPPQNIISVSFPLGGYLKYTRLLPGMRVRKGEVIAEMEDPSIVQLQQDYLVAKARMDFLEKEFARQSALNAEKVSSDKTFQQVTSEHASQRIMVSAYAEKLRLIGIGPERLTPERISRRVSIHSPINGYVSKINVNLGKYVQPVDVLFELINPDDIHAALSIFEKDLGKVAIGQKVGVSFVDEPERRYEAEIILINRNVDNDRVAVAHCHFHTRPPQLLPGMFLTAHIRTSDSRVPVLPEASVVRFAGREYVFTEQERGTFRMVEVASGSKSEGMLELVRGADSLVGRKVVTANAYSVLGAMKNKGEE